MLSQLGIEASPAVHYAIAFAIIFVLLTLFALVLRRLTGGRSMLSGQGGRTRQPRLGIVDVYDLDRQRQLILLRRDNVEHLLLIGGPNDVVIETNIVRVPGARLAPAPESLAGALEAATERMPEAIPNRPVVEPVPSRGTPEQGERTRAASFAQGAASVGGSLQPNPTRTEPVLKPDVVALQSGPARPGRPETSPAAPPAPAPRQDRATRPFQPPRGTPEPVPPAKAPDAAVLSDMAKQLEEALKRPMAPVGSVPQPAPSPAAPVRSPPARPAAPPPRQPSPEPVAKPAAPPPPAAVEPVKPAVRPQPGPAVATKPEPAPPKPAEAGQRPETPARVSDPFSVEEIEAEFARLLGRPTDKNDKG